jgi:hypothetical protein
MHPCPGRPRTRAGGGDDEQLPGPVAAVSAAGAGRSGVLTGEGAPAADGIGALAPIISYAPVTADGLAGNLGTSLVSVSRVPLEATPARHPGLIPAAALLALAVSGLILLRRVVVAPIRRLRSDAVAVASGELEHRVHQSSGQGNQGRDVRPDLPSGEAALTVARVRPPASGYVTLTPGTWPRRVSVEPMRRQVEEPGVNPGRSRHCDRAAVTEQRPAARNSRRRAPLPGARTPRGGAS